MCRLYGVPYPDRESLIYQAVLHKTLLRFNRQDDHLIHCLVCFGFGVLAYVALRVMVGRAVLTPVMPVLAFGVVLLAWWVYERFFIDWFF